MNSPAKSAYLAAYRKAHREDARAREADRYAAQRERIKARVAAYRVSHREEIRVARAARYVAHRAERLAEVAAWNAAHPERARERDRRKRAIRRGARLCDHLACLVVGPDELAWQTSDHRCWMCGVPVSRGRNLHMDHVVAIARGGLHCAGNLRPACGPCNQRKGVRDVHAISTVAACTEMTTVS